MSAEFVDKPGMEAAVGLFVMSLIAFAVSFRGLRGAVQENVGMTSLTGGYSRRAARVGRGYKIIAWGFLSLFLFAQFCQSLMSLVANL